MEWFDYFLKVMWKSVALARSFMGKNFHLTSGHVEVCNVFSVSGLSVSNIVKPLLSPVNWKGPKIIFAKSAFPFSPFSCHFPKLFNDIHDIASNNLPKTYIFHPFTSNITLFLNFTNKKESSLFKPLTSQASKTYKTIQNQLNKTSPLYCLLLWS